MAVNHLHPPNAPYQWPSMSMRRQAQAALFMAMKDMGYDTSDERHGLLLDVFGDDYSFTELTDDDAWAIVAHLRAEGWWR